MASDTIRFAIEGAIATITLNRPERMNAFNWEMIDAWAEALEECRRNDAVAAVIVTGAGKAFCSGGDIADMKLRGSMTAIERKHDLQAHVHRIPAALARLDKPVIAAINGAATGAGMDLTLMTDLRIAAESARLGETYVKVGLVPGAGGAWLLPRLVGTAKALELFWTGDLIDAQEALRIGLVNRVVPDAGLMTATRALADRIAAAPPLSVRTIKRAVYQGLESDLPAHLDRISSDYALVTGSEDHREAVAAFLEKRKPRFTGR
ncbi:MAG TPA: enoyl-CoA hydratase-related protein [Stellaceae bacterium]|nr:enoyl-CoA hydratase-related protein [Stellaceae bacterium]